MSCFFKLKLASYTDKEKIMSFIFNNWEKNHILAKDHMFFDFQYKYKDNLQFVLALDNANRIIGLLGYMQYNPEKNKQDIALALWKVIPNLSDPVLGIKLIKYLRDNVKHRSIFCVGINKKTIGIYKFMGFQTGKLLHVAAFNAECKSFSISIPPIKKKKFLFDESWNFIKTETIELSLEKLIKLTKYKAKKPYKSKSYILKRYANHPYFLYTFHEVYRKNNYLGLVISREIQHLNSAAIRIIDVLAEDKNISKILNEFPSILSKLCNKFEYIDVYASNLDISYLTARNYEIVSESKKIIVPDYFSPFVQKNIDIYFSYTDNKSSYFFKGDGDQDNPRIIKSCND